MSRAKSKTGSLATSLLLFLLVFGLWQAYDFLILPSLSVQAIGYYALNLVIYGISLLIFLLFVKIGKSDLKSQGFKKPSSTRKFAVFSIVFVLFYVFVNLLPGFLFQFNSRPPPEMFHLIFSLARAIIVGITVESIFRGYIFKNLVGKRGFFTSLYASSIMFGLYGYDPVSIKNFLLMEANQIITDVLFGQIVPAFTAGLFLGYMFYKMDWNLLGPVIFDAGLMVFFSLSPIAVRMQWWMGLAFEIIAYASLILIVDTVIQEPKFRRKRYGLEG